MPTFQKVKLGDACLNITDGKHGDCQGQLGSGYYFISSKDVFGGSIHYENAREITKTDFIDTHRRTKLAEGDILITNSGSIGRMAFIYQDDKVGNTTFQKSVAILKPNPNIANNKFLYYLLLSKYTQLVNLGGGSAQHNLLLGDLRNFETLLPDFSVQTNIASILSLYDSLIENNQKRIKYMEEMSQMLYTEWFAKFKFPEHEKVKLMDSKTEFGMIPRGWSVKELGQIAVDKRKSVDPSNVDINTPYVGLEHIPRNTIVLTDWGNAGDITSSKLLFSKGDILFGKIRPYFHKVVSAPIDGITSSDTIVISTKEQKYSSIILMCVSSDNFVSYSTITSQGTKMPRADWKTLVKYKVLIPEDSLLTEFNTLTNNLLSEMNNLMFQNRILIETRDLLIPQLVTEKREVKDNYVKNN